MCVCVHVYEYMYVVHVYEYMYVVYCIHSACTYYYYTTCLLLATYRFKTVGGKGKSQEFHLK